MAMATGMQAGLIAAPSALHHGPVAEHQGASSLHFAGSSFCGRLQAAGSDVAAKPVGRASSVRVDCGGAITVDGTAVTAARPWKTSDCWLVLEDGSVWRGKSFGATGTQMGEVVFNTSLTGYQEILTDPSYAGQFVLMTQPHIGNTGINLDDEDSGQCYTGGLIIRSLSNMVSNWRSSETLPEYLRRGMLWALLILTLELLLGACEKMVV